MARPLSAIVKDYAYEFALQWLCELQDENARLRELVRELYEDQCDECDRWKYRDRIRELGVEVE